jgi:sigma-B regulation protein RsbU (phosphoserine phosphatase)
MEQALFPPTFDIRPDLLDRREKLLAFSRSRPGDESLSRLLSEVDAALDRLEAGTYGYCETCHDPIEPERLAADPLARFCLGDMSPEELRALEDDLEWAARIQKAHLPQIGKEIAGWDFAFAFEPAGPVGGDCCDVLTHEGSDEATFLLGDVSGKGVPAAMLASSLHATIRSLAGTGLPVGSLVERANRLFRAASVSRSFATLVCGRTRARGSLEICNAGHCPPLLRSGGRVCEIAPTGLPIGTFLSADYGSQELRLAEGDFLVAFTDGLTEARDSSGVEYGSERLAALLARLERPSARSVVEACLADLHDHAGGIRSDDLSLLVVRRAEGSAPARI